MTISSAQIHHALQQIALLSTGNATNAAGLGLLESLADASQGYAPLIEAVNAFMAGQAQARSSVNVIRDMAKNALGMELGAQDAANLASLIDSGQHSWAELFAYCLSANNPTLSNRAEAAQSFLSDLQTAQKSAYFDGSAVFGAVKTLLQGVGASSVSLVSAKGNLTALVAQLKANGIQSPVIDGYVKGATVFVDANGDGVHNTGEWSGSTDANGNFVLPYGVTGGKIIATGGTDLMTGKPFQGVLTAPLGATVVTPLTTLVQALLEGGGASAQAAASAVQQALGLPAGIDLLNYDPLTVLADSAASAADKSTALAVQTAALQVVNVIAQIGAAIDAGSSADTLGAGSAVIAAVASSVASGQPVSLTNVNTLSGIAQGAATAAGASSVVGMAQDLARITAASNAAAAGADNITELAQAAVVAQGSAVTAITEGAAGGNLERVVTGFTGAALDQQINQAQPGEIAPGVAVPTPPAPPAPTPPAPPPPPGEPPPPVDVTAPVFQSAATSADGAKIILTYNEALSSTTAAAGTFDVQVGGSGNAVTAVAVSGNTVELTLSIAVARGQSVTVAYTDSTSGNDANAIQDSAGNDAASLSAQSVVNNVPAAPGDTPPDATIRFAYYLEDERLLTLYGNQFTSMLEPGEMSSTDVKARLDWTKIVWDTNGDGETTANIGFALADVEWAVAAENDRFIIKLTEAKASTLTGSTDYAYRNGEDTLTVSAGFIGDLAGNRATTDGMDQEMLSTTYAQGFSDGGPTSITAPTVKSTGYTVWNSGNTATDYVIDAAAVESKYIQFGSGVATGHTYTLSHVSNTVQAIGMAIAMKPNAGNIVSTDSSATSFLTGAGNDVLASSAATSVFFDAGGGADHITLGASDNRIDLITLRFGVDGGVWSESYVGAYDTISHFQAGSDKILLATANHNVVTPTALTRFADVEGSLVTDGQSLIDEVWNSGNFLDLAVNAAGIIVVNGGDFAGAYLYVNDSTLALDSGSDLFVKLVDVVGLGSVGSLNASDFFHTIV